MEALVTWVRGHHVKKHDGDEVGEWDYCDWCRDYGFDDAWPCMFVRAIDEYATTTTKEQRP